MILKSSNADVERFYSSNPTVPSLSFDYECICHLVFFSPMTSNWGGPTVVRTVVSGGA